MSDWLKFDPVLEAVDLVLAERRELEVKGVCLAILHRRWDPETICASGEEIAAASLRSRSRNRQLRLSRRGRVMLDLLARNQNLGLTAEQIASLTRTERFYTLYGSNSPSERMLTCDISRSAVRVYVGRLRDEIARAAEELHLAISPERVIESLSTTSRETLYRLRANVVWQHER